MNGFKIGLFLCSMVCIASTCTKNRSPKTASLSQLDNLKIRIAKIEIDSAYLDEYMAILKQGAAASIRLEEGVLCIYPMYEKEYPTQIRLLEIYASEAAYQAHLKTPHFLHYKTTTLPMVKALELVDMEAIDQDMMPFIFSKIQ